MNSTAEVRLVRLERSALAAAALALVAAVVLGWFAPHAIAPAYRFAAFACLAPAMGSLIFSLIHRLTGGQWGPPLQPFLTAGVRLLPWIWLLTVPLLFLPQEGLRRLVEPPPPPPDVYASPAMLILRAALYALFFFALGHGLAVVRRRRGAGDHTSLRWVAPAGLIALVFVLHLLAEDWMIHLEPDWHSTAFPAVWMSGQTVAGLALALFGAILGGAQPDANGAAGRPLGIDWGNLLLTAAIFWCYVAFAQFLIIWAGNLPREIAWYLHRTRGAWLWVIVGLAAFHFALPFLFLLSRRFKRFPAGLAGAALVLLVAQLVFLGWVLLPAFEPTTLLSLGLAAALLAVGLGVFVNRYLAVARRLQEAGA